MNHAARMKASRDWMVCIRLVCFLFAFLLAGSADAAVVPWKSRPFQIIANEKPLPDFLRELLASQGITAVIDLAASDAEGAPVVSVTDVGPF